MIMQFLQAGTIKDYDPAHHPSILASLTLRLGPRWRCHHQ